MAPPGQYVETPPTVVTGMRTPPSQMVAQTQRKDAYTPNKHGNRLRRKRKPDRRETRWYISATSSETKKSVLTH